MKVLQRYPRCSDEIMWENTTTEQECQATSSISTHGSHLKVRVFLHRYLKLVAVCSNETAHLRDRTRFNH